MSDENVNKPKKKRRGLGWLAIAVVALLLGAAGVTVALENDDDKAAEPVATTESTEPTPTDLPTDEPTEPTATPDETATPSPSTPTPTVDQDPKGDPPSEVAGGL